MRKGIFLKTIILLIIFYTCIGAMNLADNIQSNETGFKQNISLLEIRSLKISIDSSLSITNNSQLSLASSSGNGTKNNPFIINNKNILSCNLDNASITIQNTNKYFIIRNTTS